MNSRLPAIAALSALLTGTAAQEARATDDTTMPSEKTDAPSPGSLLASQVSEIASSTDLSTKARTKLVTNAVRLAVLTATEDLTDPAEKLKLALTMATAAGKAAPSFSTAITDAILSIPAIAEIDGASEQVKAAVFAGVKAAVFENGEVRFDTDSGRPRQTPEFHGNTGDTVVSPSF